MVFYGKRSTIRKKSKTARKPRRATRRYTKGRVPGQKSFPPFGLSEAVRLRYVQTVSLDAGAGQVKDYLFRANSMTQPSVPAVTHQPYGFDQMGALYNKYTVVGSKMTAVMTNADNGATSNLYAGILVRKDVTDLTNTATQILIEQPGNGGFKMMTPNMGSKSSVKISKSFSSKKWFHRTSIVGDPDYQGTLADDVPTDQRVYYHLIVGPQGSNDPAVINVTVTIDYWAVFTEPKALGQS